MYYFKDVTKEFLKKADPNNKVGVVLAKNIKKNGKVYYVNKYNRIKIKNHELENANWWISLMGGKIELLPEITEEDFVKIADYLYYPPKGRKYFLENKEIIFKNGEGKPGKNIIYHKILDGIGQANVFIIDCTNSKLDMEELLIRLNVV